METEPLTYALALGSSGEWRMEILETEDVGLTLVIQHPYLYLQTELPSVEVAQRFRDMLASSLEETPEVSLGRMLGAEVEASILSDRLWFSVRGEDAPPRPVSFMQVRFDLDKEREPLLRAVEGVLEELRQRAASRTT